MRWQTSFLGVGLISFLALLSACHGPFKRTGPRFDPHQPQRESFADVAGTEVTNRLDPEWLEPRAEPFTLGPGDKIEIQISGDPSSRGIATVGPDGRVYYYFLPGIDVWGLTLSQTRQRIEEVLAQYMTGRQISVTLRGIESQRVWLLGRLRAAGVYPMTGPMTLLESISTAGGLVSSTGPASAAAGGGEIADLDHSFVIREGQPLPVDFRQLIQEGDMTQNIYLRPDDFVYIPSAVAKEVYVLGAVRLPKPVSYHGATTLIAAIADAGGTIKNAYLSQVGIVRGSVSKPRIAVVNYKDIVSGRAADVRLEPRDIVYVPFSPYRNLLKYADLILATFTRAVAINEGARAVSDDIPPVGINIGVGGP